MYLRVGLPLRMEIMLDSVKTSSITRISEQPFGLLATGDAASLFTLTNRHGVQAKITNFGAIIVSLYTYDNTQRLSDIVLGYDCVADYEDDTYYLGAVIGRYAGRIDKGEIELEGEKIQLNLNAPDSQLHGGKKALNKKLWDAKPEQSDECATLTLTYTSLEGEEGYPGTVNFTVKYHLNDNNELITEYFADTNKTTIVNLTQHSYFNLSGHNSGNVLHHQVKINADYFLPMTERAYPSGEIKSVKNTNHDFTSYRTLESDIDNTNDKQISIGLGYDNYWLLNQTDANDEEINQTYDYAAQAVDPDSGRRMTIFTDQPSIILYTANYIDGTHYGKGGFCYQKRAALCLEPQRANNPLTGHSLKNCELHPDKPFYSKTTYKFDVV